MPTQAQIRRDMGSALLDQLWPMQAASQAEPTPRERHRHVPPVHSARTSELSSLCQPLLRELGKFTSECGQGFSQWLRRITSGSIQEAFKSGSERLQARQPTE